MLLHTCILAMCAITILGYPSFMAKIPNGYSVLDPCDGGTWSTVGHIFNYNEDFSANKSRNPFGKKFGELVYSAGEEWSTTLCGLDSDGDGVTNGVELGDPDCVWSVGDTPAKTAYGHPGLACDNGGNGATDTCGTSCV